MILGKIKNNQLKLAVIGLGYVGLPLAVEFGRKFDTIGFDIKSDRLKQLREGTDITRETSSADLKQAQFLGFVPNLVKTKIVSSSELSMH